MLSFIQFLSEERQGKGLTVFDIDETLFSTKANVKVMKDGKLVRSLNNQEFNSYKLKDGESYDFGEFRSAKIFNQTSTPIGKMIGKLKSIFSNAVRRGSKVIFVTARAKFDDMELLKDTFRSHDIDIDNIGIETAGDLNLGSSAKNKRFIFHKYLRKGEYARIRFFDDHEKNLHAFLSLKKQYPEVSFEAYLVKHDGSTKKYTI